jgi:uncharacterized protein YndB with AHSA1/START domain
LPRRGDPGADIWTGRGARRATTHRRCHTAVVADEPDDNEIDVVSEERLIPAGPEVIFALVTDPNRHREFDGSGSVFDVVGEVGHLSLGSSFVMSMQRGGRSYTMTSTVIALEENRKVAWQSRGPGPRNEFGGRIWSYELKSVAGGTLVRETWDITQESEASMGMVRGLAGQTRADMAASLQRIEQLVTG